MDSPIPPSSSLFLTTLLSVLPPSFSSFIDNHLADVLLVFIFLITFSAFYFVYSFHLSTSRKQLHKHYILWANSELGSKKYEVKKNNNIHHNGNDSKKDNIKNKRMGDEGIGTQEEKGKIGSDDGNENENPPENENVNVNPNKNQNKKGNNNNSEKQKPNGKPKSKSKLSPSLSSSSSPNLSFTSTPSSTTSSVSPPSSSSPSSSSASPTSPISPSFSSRPRRSHSSSSPTSFSSSLDDYAPPLILSPPSPSTHTHTFLLLHGLGDSGAGIFPLGKSLYDHFSPRLKVIIPHAPLRPLSLMNDDEIPCWHNVKSLSSININDFDGIHESCQFIRNIIQNEINEMGGGEECSRRIIVCGWSQGSAIGNLVSFNFPLPLGCIISLSGYLPLNLSKVMEENNVKSTDVNDKNMRELSLKIPVTLFKDSGGMHSANQTTPLLICHGTNDYMVSLTGSEVLMSQIEDGCGNPNVQLTLYKGMGHTTCQEEIQNIKEFIECMVMDKGKGKGKGTEKK